MAAKNTIDIKSSAGKTLLSVLLNIGAKGYYSLMQHDYIVLPFKLCTPIDFKIGSYVDLRGVFDDALGGKLAKMYYVTDNQNPTYNTSTGAYEYQLRLNAYYWLWNNFIFKYTPENAAGEASWSLTAPLDVQMGVFLRNLSALGFTYNGTPYEVEIDDTVENKAVAMTYDNIHLLDALFSMGSKDNWDCDVWVTENVIHFGRCEHGDPVKIELGVEASTMTRSESKGTFATRIYAFGSTRNIPENYRPADESLTVNGVVQKRLMLPVDTPYIDAYPGMAAHEVVEAVVVFDDIFPRRIGTISDVRTVDRAVTGESGEQVDTFKAYQYRDSGFSFKEDYVLPGKELRVIFQSGKLNGLDFAVQFNPENADPAEQLWEIVANEDYGRLLPDETIKPEDGDTYLLYGFDIQLVSDQYTPEAEQELKERTEKYVKKTMVDDGTYATTLRNSWVSADPLRRTFDVGQRIRLVNPGYFPAEGRESRVIGWEMNLDIPTDAPIYTIGESTQYSRIGEIEDKVDTLVYKGSKYVGTGGSGVYVVRTNDSTPPSDTNVFSALRSLATFLRKDQPDATQYLLRLLAGAEFGEFVDSLMAGKGAGIMPDGRGQFERLEVRGSLSVLDLMINQVQGMEADYFFSEIGKVESVEDLGESTYRLKIEKRTEYDFTKFQENDVCFSIVNTLLTGGADYYTSWMRVLAKNAQENTLTVSLYPDSEVPDGKNHPPLAGYNLTRRGNSTLPEGGGFNERAQSWLLSSREGRIMFLANVYKPILEDYNYALAIGKLPNIKALEKLPVTTRDVGVVAQTGIFEKIYQFDYNGDVVPNRVDRGQWSLETAQGNSPYRRVTHESQTPAGSTYTLLEQHTVYHLGCKWGCLIDKTQLEPKWNSPSWEMLEGDKNYGMEFLSSRGWQFFRGQVNTDITACIAYSGMDITDDVMAHEGVEVEWLRDSGNVPSDNTWKPVHVDGRLNTLRLSNADMPADWGSTVRTVLFICRVFIPVGGEVKKVENYVGFKL